MSEANEGSTGSPSAEDTDTEQMYGGAPPDSPDADTETDTDDVEELGAEDDLSEGSTGALPEG